MHVPRHDACRSFALIRLHCWGNIPLRHLSNSSYGWIPTSKSKQSTSAATWTTSELTLFFVHLSKGHHEPHALLICTYSYTYRHR